MITYTELGDSMKKLIVMSLLLSVSVCANAYLQECFYGMDCIRGKVFELCDEECQMQLEAEQAALKTQEREAAARKARQAKEAAALSKIGKVRQVNDEISVVLSNDILFEYGKSNLSKKSKKTLNQAVAILNNNPNNILRIQGHTDSTGSEEHNMKLSQERAKAVYDYMKYKGLKIKKVTYKGYGETKPVASNSTKAGRAANRRVEFRIR